MLNKIKLNKIKTDLSNNFCNHLKDCIAPSRVKNSGSGACGLCGLRIGGGTDIYCGGTDIYSGGTDIYCSGTDKYDLIAHKYEYEYEY